MTTVPSYVAGGELAPTRLWLTANGTLVDLSTGYDLSVIVGKTGTTLLEKTSGLTGAVGAMTPPFGTPNLTIAWDVDEIHLPPGQYTIQVQARNGDGLDYRWVVPLDILRGYEPVA
jgi:hypothetical protein